MSTHKHFDKICCVILILTLIVTGLFMNAEKFGIHKASSASSSIMEYENKLFDNSSVHTIDIIMDDWENFTANCKSEEYYACSVVIDNEAYKNVAIRGKGNTSLTQVDSYGNDRYSFKIEFDHYNSGNSYYGLDKLCLNNIIQDNTYMKDYLTYQMMNEMGVASPLCSYVYITVNSEDWGLYLAVEGVEESFLQRNYGNDYGGLYKPDSQSMGGGRGNGENFDMDMDEISNDSESDNMDNTDNTQNNNTVPQMPNGTPPDDFDSGQIPEDIQNGQTPDSTQTPQIPDDFDGGQIPNGMTPPNDNNMQMPDGMTPPYNSAITDDSSTDNDSQESKDDVVSERGNQMLGGDMQGGNKGGMTNGSDDVLLKYIDDDADSYSNIFDNAKTDVSDSDKERLIESLKKLNNGEDLDDTVDIDKVIRYFVVHNFVLNFDSYTGSMIHNYYLYEKDGQMQMIPWDYNLAFGGFKSTDDATSLVNYPIDSPISGGNTEDRPMIAWIFENDEYTELYHQYFAEFITEYFDSGYFSEMIDNVNTMISPYVEKDPTKFCTYEEFKAGIATLKQFCLLRAESISGQLNGEIGSTTESQQSDSLIDADEIEIKDMGSMNNMENGMQRNDDRQNSQTSNDNTDGFNKEKTQEENPTNFADSKSNQNTQMQPPDKTYQQNDGKNNKTQSQKSKTLSSSTWILIGISILVLGLGIFFALIYKRRK